MLEFKPIIPADFGKLKNCFSFAPACFCDRTPGIAVLWRNVYSNHLCFFDNTVIVRSVFGDLTEFLYPSGKNINGAIEEIIAYCEEQDIACMIYSATDEEADALLEKYPKSQRTTNRDWSDYIYDKNAMMSLSGRKYATQRNHINKFKSLYPEYSFERITEKDLPELIEFTENFTFPSQKSGNNAAAELGVCIDTLKNFSSLELFGAALKIDGKIIGYSIGEIIGDMLFVHIEKADTSYPGSYQMVTNLFLKEFASDESVKFVNREDDCGDEGLRRSKLSYHPLYLPAKNRITIIKNR